MRIIMLALGVALGLCTGAAAQQSPPAQCAPVDLILAMEQAHPAYASHHVATAAEVAVAAEVFNAYPPETQAHWGEAVLVQYRDGSGSLIVGNDGMACGKLTLTGDVWPAVARKVRGSPS